MNKLIYPVLAALALTGCVNETMSRLSESHPGNPTGVQASYPQVAPFLMTDTNLVVMTTVLTNGPEHGHQHDAKTKPAPKAPPKHDHD